MAGYINSWKNAQMYRWFHKASFMCLRGKKRLGFCGPPIQISLKSPLTILHAQSLVLGRKQHHIFIMRNVQKPIYFKISGCFWKMIQIKIFFQA